MSIRDRLDEVALALAFLTRLPFAATLSRRAIPLSRAAWAFPLVGVIVGLIASVALILPLPGLVRGPLALGLVLLVTGALYEIGFACFVTAIRRPDRAAILRAMDDARPGPRGLGAVILTLLIRAAALTMLGPAQLIAALAGGGGAVVLAAAVLPPVGSDGLSRAMSGVTARSVLAAAIIVAGAALLAGPGSALAIPAGLIAVGLIIRLARHRLGGQTGDVLNAAAVVAEAVMLIAFALTR